MNNILSLQTSNIWEKLKGEISQQVTRDGIRKDSILPGEIESDVLEEAVENIYSDVSGFYSWYFNGEDNRAIFLTNQHPVDIHSIIKESVRAVVEDNLDAMREVDEIPVGQDVDGLDDVITDSLSRYIINWEDWYYDRKREEAIENYFEQKSIYEDTYLDGDYGDLTNLLDGAEYDGISDVPFLSKELGLDGEN